MKKDRNCGMSPYPIYPPYQGINPGIMPMGVPVNTMPSGMVTPPTMNSYPNNSGVTSNTMEQQLNTLQEEINTLQKRVSNLETLFNQSNNTSSKYNSSNYQMM